MMPIYGTAICVDIAAQAFETTVIRCVHSWTLALCMVVVGMRSHIHDIHIYTRVFVLSVACCLRAQGVLSVHHCCKIWLVAERG